jgi:hypothetical protein
MSKELVLHLAANPNPVSLKVKPEVADDLRERLTQIVRNGHTQIIEGANGEQFVVNFSHVVIAYFS